MDLVNITEIIHLAQEAGGKIMEIYQNEALFAKVEHKADNSPLTLADKCANEIITNGLKSLYPHIPIISEEDKTVPYTERKNWQTFWLVDPLDGTKEFVKRNGEFTVNIALIHNGEPLLGVIQVPVSGDVYYANEQGAFKTSGGNTKKIYVAHKTKQMVSVGSRSHVDEKEELFLAKYNIVKTVSVGSSLKFCLVAEGIADIYYRLNPTMEWDTAAGHALVNKAGGKITGLTYNKENMLNGSFCCSGF
jgi:3'(2'), 5'-bisphosphate nucleotidase